MAINNWGHYLNAPLLDTPAANLFENLLKGYKMGREPAQIKAKEEEQQLANHLKRLDVEHKPKEYELNDKHQALANSISEEAYKHLPEQRRQEAAKNQAYIDKANRPAQLKGALAEAFQLRNQLDPNSPNYERDLREVNNYIAKLGTMPGGVQVSGSPGGEFNISVGGGAKGETANIAGLPALPKGQVWLYDDNGQVKGRGQPYSEAEKKEVGGRTAFNIYQKFITDAQAPYSGRGSNEKFENDVLAYETDPAAKDRIDKLLAADKLLFSATVKEEATLGGANTNQAYNRITHSLKTSEIYPKLQQFAQYQLPSGYAKAPNDIFRNVLNEGTEAGAKIPAFKAYYTKQGEPIESPEQAAQKKALSKGDAAKAKAKAAYLAMTPAQRLAYKKQHLGDK